jgi:hypothetical protein
MHFGIKNYLKSTHNHTAKQAQKTKKQFQEKIKKL